jgi:hypothetical protein
VSDNPSAQRAQELSQQIVTDLRSRDRWMKAFNEAMPHVDDVTALTVAIGNRIALHHNVRDRRCDPGYPVLAKEMHCSPRTVMRAIKLIEDHGWLRRKRGGSEANVNFTLLFPCDLTRGTKPAKPDPMGDNKLSPMEETVTCPVTSPYVTNSASIGDTQGGSTNNRGSEQSRSAASPRASASGDIDGPVTRTDRARALSALEALEDHLPCNFKDNTQHASMTILDEMIEHGTNINDLLLEADQYCDRVTVTGETPLPMATWLQQQRGGITMMSSH